MGVGYQAVKEAIERDIQSGTYQIGQRLPSEYELSKDFGVSRVTLRSAIKLLELEGKLLVKHGIGTFVVNQLPTIPTSLEKLQSIGSMIQLAGLEEGERQESIGSRPCRRDWAKIFGVEAGTEVMTLERFRTANGEPVAFSLNVIPKVYVGEAFVQKTFTGSLFSFLERECHIRLVHADTELIVPQDTDRYCQKLRIKPDTTILLMKQLHYDETNRPILYSLDYLRNDIFRFWVRRHRK
ncbi:MAG: GntR family transcriptional regulator [Desulfitobacteriaceae bacterium]